PVEIVAHGWWTYWALTYLAGNEPRVTVLPCDVPGQQNSVGRERTGETARLGRSMWQVQFTEEAAAASSAVQGLKESWPLVTIVPDAGGRALLSIIAPQTRVRKVTAETPFDSPQSK